MEFIDDFLSLELSSPDVILKIQWLDTLGTMEMNWNTLMIKFRVGMTMLTLQRDPTCNAPK